nr:hypothetical protein [Tanacetum cinerariifolium]
SSRAPEQDDAEGGRDDDEEGESNEEDDNEETREEESFDPIPKTPECSEDEGDGEEDQGLNVNEEEHVEEEEKDKLYRDVNINQGRGLQATIEVEDTHVTLTSINSDGQSSHSSRTSYAVVADLSEMELKKILIEKMEGNKSIQCSDEQRKLYKALDEGPSAGSDRGFKRQRESKEPELASAPLETTTKSAGRSTTRSKFRQVSASESDFAVEPVQTTSQMDEPSHLVFETGADHQPIVQSSQHPKWFSQPLKPPTPDHDWNKTLPVVQGSTQTWISELAKQDDSRSSFNELMDTPLDFSNFIMNRLRVDTLTHELLAGPTFELMKGLYKSLIELEYHLEEVYKATTDQLDWVNPEGQQYLHNLLQPLSLIPNNRGRRVIPFAHFINN